MTEKQRRLLKQVIAHHVNYAPNRARLAKELEAIIDRMCNASFDDGFDEMARLVRDDAIRRLSQRAKQR